MPHPLRPVPVTTRLLTGWGGTAATSAQVVRPTRHDEVLDLLTADLARGLVARGLARSYGDAAQNSGGQVLDMTALDGIESIDLVAGQVTVGAGLSLDRLLSVIVPLGWFVAVTPGTRFVTVGGAIASDVHGKNHHVDGGFCQWVESFTLVTPTGSREVTATSDRDVFWATAGGMGLTGVITRATLRLVPVETSKMLVRTEQIADLDGALERMSSDEGRYSVAWIDLLARGAATGRSVLMTGDHAPLAALPAKRRAAPLAYAPSPRFSAPPWFPSGMLNAHTVRAFNELWFRKSPALHEGLESIPTFFHPLDGIQHWNRIYGKRGFLQYQFVVPHEADQMLRDAVSAFSAAQVPSFLAVLKRLGPQPGLLSFPFAGWTLALDVPQSTPGLAALLTSLDQRVAEAGGRVYLSKDSRLRPELLAIMYPELPRWQEIQSRLDPKGIFRSDLSRRLPLLPS